MGFFDQKETIVDERKYCYINSDFWIKQYKLEIKTFASSIVNSLQISEYPDRNDSTIRSQGFVSPVHHLTVYFRNETYKYYPEFILDLYSSTGKLISLEHVDIGTVEGKIRTVNPRRNERKFLVELDIEFIEGGGEYELPTLEYSSDDIRDNFIKTILKDISMLAGKIGDVTDLSAITAEINSTIGVFEGTMTSIANPANSLLNTINFGTSLSGRCIKAISQTCERYTELYKGALTAYSYIEQMFFASDEMQNNTTGELSKTMINEFIQIAFTLAASLQYSSSLENEENAVQAQIVSENQPSVTADGEIHTITSDIPELDDDGIIIEKDIEITTMQDAIDTLNLMLSQLQISIDIARIELPELMQSAVILKTITRNILLKTEQIITIIVQSDLPLHLILFQNNLPYAYDKRVLALNPEIWNPNFIKKGTELKIYAK